jgi:replicative DNA helicase
MHKIHNRIDFEELILGSILYDDKCVDDVLDIINIDDFYLAKHKIIFNVMLMLLSEGSPIDCFLIEQKLTTLGQLEIVGGLAELIRLRTNGFTPSSAKEYAKIIARESVKRQLSRALNNAQEALKNDGEDFLEVAHKEIFSVAERSKNEPKNGRDIMPRVYSKLIDLYENKKTFAGLSTGFNQLDSKTGGLMPCELIIAAARPGMGKTIFGLNIFEHVVFDLHKTAAFFSLEMPDEQIMHRILSSRGNVLASKFKSGNFVEQDIANINEVQKRIFNENLIINDLREISAIDIRSRCRSIKRKHGLDLVIVDYLGLIKRDKAENTNQQIGQITKQLRNLAQEVDCPVLLLSQLNRNLESRVDKRPITADLRDSGEIEQDADLILFIYRDEVYNSDTADKGIAEINIAKHRTGETGMFKLGFEGHYYRFSNSYTQPNYAQHPNAGSMRQKYSYKRRID